MDDELKQLFEVFAESTHEALTELDNSLVDLENGDFSSENLDSIRRHLHTLKGSCSMFGVKPASELAHALEDLMVAVIDSNGAIEEASDYLFEGKDLLKSMIEGFIECGGKEENAIPELEVFVGKVEDLKDSIANRQVNIDELSLKLIDKVTELREEFGAIFEFEEISNLCDKITRYIDFKAKEDNEKSVEYQEYSEEEIQEKLNQPVTNSSSVNNRTVRISEKNIDSFLETVGELISAAEMCKYLQRQLATKGLNSENLYEFRSMSEGLYENVFLLQKDLMNLRRVSLNGIFKQIPRLVRDGAKTTGKKIQVDLHGGDSTLDKSLLNTVEHCLVQIIRNSIAHGIETPEKRRENNKIETGMIRISAYNEDRFLIIEINDDGKGLDLQKVGEKAVRMGVVDAEALSRMSEQETAMLIFRSGLSTADSIDMSSGRGVGLDVVESEIRKRGGSITVETKHEKGTRINLKMPLDVTVSVASGIIAQSGSERFIIPTEHIVESLNLSPEMVNTVEGKGETILVRNEILSLVRINSIFGIKEQNENEVAVILQYENKKAAFVFDQLQDIQQVVIKNIKGIRITREITGGAILNDGKVGLVLNVEGMLTGH